MSKDNCNHCSCDCETYNLNHLMLGHKVLAEVVEVVEVVEVMVVVGAE